MAEEKKKASWFMTWKEQRKKKADHGNTFMSLKQDLQRLFISGKQDRGADSVAQGLSSQSNTPRVQRKPTLTIKTEHRFEDKDSFTDSFKSTSSPIPGTVKPPFRDSSIFQSISPIKSESSYEHTKSAWSTGRGFGYSESARNTGFGSQNSWFSNDAMENNSWTGSRGSDREQNRFW